MLSSVTLSGSGMQNGFLNQAQVEFDLSGTTLTVTLTNTSPQVFNQDTSGDTLQPTNVLSGVLFDIAGNPTLTPGNASLASGSTMVNTGSSADTSASGWGLGSPSGGNFNRQAYGIEAFGGISTPSGEGNFANSNTPPNSVAKLDGIDYGIVGSGYVPGTGNGQLPTTPFEQTSEVFQFTVPSSFTDVSQISNVEFQYGTSNGEAAFGPNTSVPTLITTPNPTNVTLSDATPPVLTDSAKLSGGNNPTGTITFYLFAPGVTPNEGYSNYLDKETVPVNGDNTYTTPVGYPLPTDGSTVTGTYQWDAFYSGDPNNSSAGDTNNSAEQVTINPANPKLVTTASATGLGANNALGTTAPTLNDAAVLSGGYYPTGSVTFYLFAPGATPASDFSNALYHETDGLSLVSGQYVASTATGYTLPTSGAVTGTYQWEAVYGGDKNNSTASDTSRSTQEQVKVNPANPSIVTTATPTGTVFAGTTAPTLKDSAVLSGGYYPTGSVTFYLFAPGVIPASDFSNALYHETDGLSLVSGQYVANTATGYTLPNTGVMIGTFQWEAVYGGDKNNSTASDTSRSTQEQVTVADQVAKNEAATMGFWANNNG